MVIVWLELNVTWLFVGLNALTKTANGVANVIATVALLSPPTIVTILFVE